MTMGYNVRNTISWTIIVHGPKGSLSCFEGKQKGAITPKLERPRPPKSVYMHNSSILTCINFLGRFRSIKFFDDQGKFDHF